MRCAICDSVLQLHSRSDICPTCVNHIRRAGDWYVNPVHDDSPLEQAIQVERITKIEESDY